MISIFFPSLMRQREKWFVHFEKKEMKVVGVEKERLWRYYVNLIKLLKSTRFFAEHVLFAIFLV